MTVPAVSRLLAWALVGMGLVALASGQTAQVTVIGVSVLTLLGVALLGAIGPRPSGGRIPAALGLLAAVLAFAARVTDAPVLAAFEAPDLVVAFLLVGGVSLTGGTWGTHQVRHISLGVGGLVLFALGISSLFVQLGTSEIVVGRGLAVIPWPLAIAAVIAGMLCVLKAWTEGPAHATYPDWVLAGVLVAGIAASMLVWRALVAREVAQLDALTQQAANNAALSMRRRIEAIASSVHQFALGRQQPIEDPFLALSELLRDTPGTDVLAIIDSTGRPVMTLPPNTRYDAFEATIPPRAMAIPGAGRAPVSFLTIPNDTTHLMVHATRCVAGACRGGAAAIMSAENQLQRMIADRHGWTFEISSAAFEPAELEDRSGRTASVGLPGIDWWLVARPTRDMVRTVRSSVPEMSLILGLVLTALLAGTVRIAGSAWENARAVERLRITSAVARATDAVWEWEVGSGRLHRSPDLWRHLGYDPETRSETLDEWFSLIHPDDRAKLTESLASLGDPATDDFETEYRVRTASGDWHIVVDRGRIVEFDLEGAAQRVMGITADVTRSRRAERELREVEALSSMGRVAARVAHEINNPLAGIRSAFALVKDAVPGDHPHRHYVGAIEREVDRIASVTRQLYEVYRPDQEPGNASLATIINDAVALLGQVNRSANVDFNLQLDGVPSVVPVSGGVLRQIVYNLIQNAVDASPAGGTVDVLARMEESDLVLEVHDQGPGVPGDLRTRIFEPFFTTKDASVRTSGMGLGLSMVSRSVAAAHGSIAVDDAPSGGARFTVRLPLTNGGSA